ncbi:class I SAM-dependent methyltransferase [Streptomyces sp. NPDC001750]|uniref:class I SAM-dependent methyltransferase n=1 Tax=Streptomyces sp. NPDC001750 TaxID=3364607 RepID=UPI003693E673
MRRGLVAGRAYQQREARPPSSRTPVRPILAVLALLFDDIPAPVDRCRRAAGVLLGAGLNARAYRLPWPRGCTVFEVDQEEALAFKQRTPDGPDGLDAVPRARRVTGPLDRRRIRDSNS